MSVTLAKWTVFEPEVTYDPISYGISRVPRYLPNCFSEPKTSIPKDSVNALLSILICFHGSSALSAATFFKSNLLTILMPAFLADSINVSLLRLINDVC